MQDKIKDIATRVKELRELKDISITEMAACIQCTEEYYTSFEAGKKDIAASRLNEIAQKLDVDLSLLLTGSMPRMNSFTVTRKGKGVEVKRRKEYQYQNLASNFHGKKVEPFFVTVPIKGDDCKVSCNSHPGQEMDFILEGTLKVVICGNEIILHEGDSIYYDSSNPHGMVALGDIPAKFIAIIM
ncbi:MAG: XRE family transcriptional regulator [Lentisphaeria bacterium]